jgi:hypothetical protein
MDLRDEETAQYIRLLDVFVIGPLMIYAGLKADSLPKWAKMALIVFGVSTIGYNANNYLSISSERKEKVKLGLSEKAAMEALEEAAEESPMLSLVEDEAV